MKRSSVAHLQCSIAQALEVVGEWWTPLVLRSVMLGQHRFEGLQGELGIARNILADRLATLVRHDVLVRVKYHDHPERYEYHLSAKGRDLFGALAALMAWGDRWYAPSGPPVEIVHLGCGQRCAPAVVCSCCGAELTLDEVRIEHGPGFVAACEA